MRTIRCEPCLRARRFQARACVLRAASVSRGARRLGRLRVRARADSTPGHSRFAHGPATEPERLGQERALRCRGAKRAMLARWPPPAWRHALRRRLCRATVWTSAFPCFYSMGYTQGSTGGIWHASAASSTKELEWAKQGKGGRAGGWRGVSGERSGAAEAARVGPAWPARAASWASSVVMKGRRGWLERMGGRVRGRRLWRLSVIVQLRSGRGERQASQRRADRGGGTTDGGSGGGSGQPVGRRGGGRLEGLGGRRALSRGGYESQKGPCRLRRPAAAQARPPALRRPAGRPGARHAGAGPGINLQNQACTQRQRKGVCIGDGELVEATRAGGGGE